MIRLRSREEVDYGSDDAMGSADAAADVLASDECYYDEMWYSAEDFPDFPVGAPLHVG